MDVKTAFLNVDIDTEIFIEQPQGYQQNSNLACKLRKGIYGLKQSPRLWNKKLDTFMNTTGFQRSICDQSIYYKISPNSPSKNVLISIWVDDIIIVASSEQITDIKQNFKNEFQMTDQGNIAYILGISIIRNRSTKQIQLYQPQYIKTILERFQISKAHIAHTPSDTGTQLQKASENNVPDPKIPYRQAIGSLMYLMLTTRPDIAIALNKTAQHSSNYDDTHWTAVKRIIRYIKGTSNFALTLGITNNSNNDTQETILTGASDSDWAGDIDD